MTQVKIEQTLLTPALARELLGTNKGNRPVKRYAISKYAIDMVNDRWKFTAEPLKIDHFGNLLDGQNRCHAVLKATEMKGSEVSIPVLIVRGLDPDAQDAMDTGAGRSVADQLARRGIAHYARTAAALRCIGMHRHKGKKEAVTHAAMLDIYDSDTARIVGTIETLSDYYNSSGVNTSVLSAAKYLIEDATTDQAAIEDFFAKVMSGADLPDGSPILALRVRSLAAKLEREHLPNPHSLSMVLRTWNAWRTGQSMRKMPVRVQGVPIGVTKIEP